jgi:predicted pyridoxine 5'-phosphate oxidase superfamily flavin-nucleotide-binding protein
MQLSEKVKEYLQAEGRANVLATADKAGRVNLAAFGSLQLGDDNTLLLMLGDNRSIANLKDNPYAACMITLHGKTGMAQEGCRLYLKVQDIVDGGAQWEKTKARIQARIGAGADMLRHLVRFEIVEARPILDFGQGV